MSSPTAVPTDPLVAEGLSLNGLWHASFRSMASSVRVQLDLPPEDARECHRRVRTLFTRADAECTRFDEDSDLMGANAAGERWWPVGAYCFEALLAARDAHLESDGWFEPRVLRTLVDLGYSRTLPFADGVDVGERGAVARPPRGPWEPDFDLARQLVRVGPEPVDLGGIGKGLALRWAGEELRAGGCEMYLVDAGGDCIGGGDGPDGSGWQIGVEDPCGGELPVAVLRVTDGACATSSTRWLSWRAGDRQVHHLIDPRTGLPGGAGLRSVTVLGDDPAEAEVWTKVLFLQGEADIAAAAERRALDALWVRDDGTLGMTASMRPHVVWRRA
jgi:thiamine biosynthesis lipoprotein